MESVVFIFALIDCCALIFLAVYFVSLPAGGAGRAGLGTRGAVGSTRAGVSISAERPRPGVWGNGGGPGGSGAGCPALRGGRKRVWGPHRPKNWCGALWSRRAARWVRWERVGRACGVPEAGFLRYCYKSACRLRCRVLLEQDSADASIYVSGLKGKLPSCSSPGVVSEFTWLS